MPWLLKLKCEAIPRNFTDPTDIAALAGLIVMLISVLSWLIRRWIKDQIETEIEPHLREDEESVASYAHEELPMREQPPRISG